MNIKKIVITGGPSTGKTSLIKKIGGQGFPCFEEISREITLEARKAGISQLFITDPLLFSERILEGRIQQFRTADTLDRPIVFFDRGIPDVPAYMDCFGQTYGQHFKDACISYKYDHIFLLPPWEAIHVSDNERYESYDEARRIHIFLERTYTHFGYKITHVPKGTVEGRTTFILNTIKNF